MKNKETVEALNRLIQINNNRIEGYTRASEYHVDEETKYILFQLMETCKNCKTELISEILQLGGVPSKGIKGSSLFFRLMVSTRNAFRKDLQKTTLNSCSYSECAAIDIYNEVLKNKSGHITPELIDLLNTQHISIKKNHRDVKGLQLKFQA
jgi:uncharacterized protein (TIGR02284 family)